MLLFLTKLIHHSPTLSPPHVGAVVFKFKSPFLNELVIIFVVHRIRVHLLRVILSFLMSNYVYSKTCCIYLSNWLYHVIFNPFYRPRHCNIFSFRCSLFETPANQRLFYMKKFTDYQLGLDETIFISCFPVLKMWPPL